ncbi:hypothetical protein FHS16_002129 [Paenibacillus endophyticus]|uniref:Flagellar Assembly Protein A N-terminal region domain-containing protein n=1 Tax=Paenibacillus endophyticus TaxID=1294268 RepID=A0A7W5C6Q0_9BACL|nr:FapA family protein [Paenibacillus endophyticus]MBB3152083.1 hypothetical protein [Paenibacillus endophyticus]
MDNLQLESYLSIQTSADKLSAFITFSRITDEFECNGDELERFLRSKGIVYGLRTEVLNQIGTNPLTYCKEQTLIAQGEPPLPGKDGYVKLVHDVNKANKAPAELEDGKVDFKEVVQLKNVKRGQLIAERFDPTPGPAGKTVTGEEIPSKTGKSVRFKVGKNVVLNDQQTAMYSAIDGLISLTDKEKINVFPVYEVNGDVDYSVGNIDFVGTVVIRGNVLSGFRIKASGDIRVIGGVEGAEIESEGSIEITGGILGGNKGFVKAARNVRSSFIQDSNVIAGEEVLVSQSIMHSHVKAGKNVICSGAKGLIVGGLVQAGDLVSARTVGNSMSTATIIEVGVNPEYRTELLDLRTRGRQYFDNLDKTDKALTILDQLAAAGHLTPEKLALRIKLTTSKRQIVMENDAVKSRILEIERTLEDTERSKVDVSNIVYGGTKIVIGRYTKFVKDSSQRVSFRYSDGDIVLVPYSS